MPHQHQNQQPELAAPRAVNSMSGNVQELLGSTRSQPPANIIKRVHDSAMIQYHRTKKEKQQELSPRILEAHRSGDRTAFKNAKKKVDNHASSVASRYRRAYLISSFENLVKTTMEERTRLAELVVRQNVAAAKKDAEMRRMQLKIAKLTKQVDTLVAQISKLQSNYKSSSVQHSHHSTWNPDDFSSMETIAHSSTAASASADPPVERKMDEFSELDPATVNLVEFEGDGTHSSGTALTSYLDSVGSQTPGEGSQPGEGELKMDSSDWGRMPFVGLRDAQAQMKADTQNNVLFPAV